MLKFGNFSTIKLSLNNFPSQRKNFRVQKVNRNNNITKYILITHWIITKLMKIDERCHQKHKFQITFQQKMVRLLLTKNPYYVHNYPT